uniref:Uncharacterized protein n=1 Tax=Anguilla anguilla TaxID=7936 RepID=A0A0E9RXZ1_ANGAN
MVQSAPPTNQSQSTSDIHHTQTLTTSTSTIIKWIGLSLVNCCLVVKKSSYPQNY